MANLTVWTIVEYDTEDGPALIRSPDGAIEWELKPATINQVLRVLAAARTADDNRPFPGWRTRAEIQHLVAAGHHYEPSIETISRYVSELINSLKLAAYLAGIEMPPLIERRKKLGMRLADGVRIRWTSTLESS